MGKFGKVIGLAALVVVAAGAALGGKWYHTTTMETIDPARGIYGMDGLEIWIDLNARMPDFARVWACDTLLKREAEAMGGVQSLRKPYGCDANFAAQRGQAPMAIVDTVIQSNIRAAIAQVPDATAAQQDEFGSCVKSAVATALSPERQAAANGGDTAAMGEAVTAANAAAGSCLPKLRS